MTKSELPEHVRPYVFHGVELKIGDEEATGECPFCGKPQKFNVNILTSKFKCWSCNAHGNSVTFLRDFWELSNQSTLPQHYSELCESSGFLDPESPKDFGVVRNPLNDKWIVPGYNVEQSLTGLYKFGKIKKELEGGRYKWLDKLLPTPGMGHHLFNMHNYDPKKPIIDLCEGWRDGIAWFECLKLGKHNGTPFLKNRNVVAVPGTNSFKPQWSKFFAGKVVNILYDNDHPGVNKHTGQPTEPAGLAGVRAVSSILSSYSTPPEQINFLAWGGDSKGFTETLLNGMDLRDFLRGEA